GDGPAVVARDLEVAVAEVVERVAPAAVTAVQRQRADPFRVPAFLAGENGAGQVHAQPRRVAHGGGACVSRWGGHGNGPPRTVFRFAAGSGVPPANGEGFSTPPSRGRRAPGPA